MAKGALMRLKIVKVFLLVILPFVFVGCSQVQQFTLKASKANLDNAAVSRQAIDEFMSTWSLNSGAITCGTEEIIAAITLKDIKKLDEIVQDAGKWSDEDYGRGCFAGVTIKIGYRELEALIKYLMGASIKGAL
jgi:hypothetical protein